MSLEQYIQKRIERQEGLMIDATENGRAWREIIVNELKEVLIHLRQSKEQVSA